MLNGIQYARAIAALMVVLSHASGHLIPALDVFAHGTRGVEVFFVISGFIMGLILGDQPVDRTDFMARRLIRIVPLYWLIVLWSSRHALVEGELWREVALDLAFIPHVRAGTDLVVPTFYPGWTLNYEIFFYLVLTVFAGMKHRLWLICGGLSGLTLLGAIIEAPSPLLGFYTSHHLSLFAAGLLLERACRHTRPPAAVVSAIGMTACAALVLVLPDSSMPVLTVGLPAVGVVWFATGLGREGPQQWLLLLGDASYSIYLFHQQGMALAEKLLTRVADLPSTALAGPDAPAWAGWLVVLAGIGWGVLISRLLERPLLTWMTRRWKAWRQGRPTSAT